MKTCMTSLKLLALLTGIVLILPACSSTEGGASQDISGGGYYGTAFYDPWYHGVGVYHTDVIVTPPPPRPVAPPHIEHPIATPPPAAAPRPMPSIPSTPRPALRR